MKWELRISRGAGLSLGLVLLVLVAAVVPVHAGDKDKDKEDWDAYKLRLDLFWFYSQPSGTFSSAGNAGSFDLRKDIGFNSYSTFTGKVDWKFTRKNHLYFIGTDFDQSKTVTLNRTIVFQGQTFNVGAATTGNLGARVLIPGYQYDFIRRKRWNLGAQVQLDIFDVSGSLSAVAQVNNGVPQSAAISSGRVRAPLPVAGPHIRFYPASRLFVDANVLGMYFFGYGNFVSSTGTVGFKLTKNLAVQGGYQLGSRLNVNTKSSRIGINLTQKGAVAGLQISF
jgi:hypothetical protein